MCAALIVRKVVVVLNRISFWYLPLHSVSNFPTDHKKKALKRNNSGGGSSRLKGNEDEKQGERFFSVSLKTSQVHYTPYFLLCSWQSHCVAAADHVEWNIGQIFSHSIISFLISHQNQIQKEGLLKKTPKRWRFFFLLLFCYATSIFFTITVL